MAVYVFDVNYTLKMGVEERDWVAKIAAFTQDEAINTVARVVNKKGGAKIARINSIGRECTINEISDELRNAIGKQKEVIKEVVKEVEVPSTEKEVLWKCPWTGKEFKNKGALKGHFTRIGVVKQDETEEEKSNEEFTFSEE